MSLVRSKTLLQDHRPARSRLVRTAGLILVLAVFAAWGNLKAQAPGGQIGDVTGDYDFLQTYNTLAILQEDQMLKGYIDVFQGGAESDAVLSYPITIGERKGNHIEFRTRKIHEMYYRFSGTVQPGKGKKKGDADYLELVGELQTIQYNSVTDQQKVDRRQVVFKSKGTN